MMTEFIDLNDRSFFNAVVEQYYPALFLFAVKSTHDHGVAEDVVQEAFASLWLNRQKVDNKTYLRHYLYNVVRNLSVNHFRRMKNRSELTEQIPDPEDFSVNYIRSETLRMLYEAINTLPPRSARVLRLTLDGKKQEEIAAEMEITVWTVKALKAEGIKKLKKILGAGVWLLFF